jgi:membrane fusion protein
MSDERTSSIFREEARAWHARAEEPPRRLDVSPPWSWTLLWVLLALLAAALVFAFAGRVEVNSRAIGILRPTTGVQLLTSQVAGTVASVAAQSGEAVAQGDVVLGISAPQLEGQLLEARRQVELLESDFRAVSQQQDRLHQQRVAQARIRLAKLEEQGASDKESLAAAGRKREAVAGLAERGLMPKFAVLDAEEVVAQAGRRLTATEQSIAAARQELASMDSERESDLWLRRQSLDGAQSRLEALELSNRQTQLRAPQDGVIEALLVKPGDVVQAGQTVGKLIPGDASLRVVSFLAEKDRAFVQVGSEVRLELDQLPYGEYGTLGARVERISDDLASPHEIQEALGEGRSLESPSFRVVLAITDDGAARSSSVRLRSGMLMQVRYTLRRQRPITLVLEPLRQWLH